ncbi:hypothetical protein BGZ57DRAFT_233307 [Hyaloscypha finlandica]|nr:hypothetical protein BGZ57DRAFT_233307 [Hyaloscypha finlandica]
MAQSLSRTTSGTSPPLIQCTRNVTVGQSVGVFWYGNWTVPGWFCGVPLLHLFKRGGRVTAGGLGRISRVSVLASPQGLIGLVVGPFAANMFAASWISNSRQPRGKLGTSADMT